MLSVTTHLHSTLPSTTQFAERLAANKNKENLSDQDVEAEKSKTDDSSDLSEQRQLQTLKNRDREVRAHELAHVSVGGQYTSGARFTYEKGSDGILYAVAGEVSINTSSIANNPQATLEKAQIIQRAALAPAAPSPQDRSVAASAAAMAQKARIDIAKLQLVESSTENKSESDPSKKDSSVDVYA